MKTISAVALMTLGLAAAGMAAEFKGFVEDTACSGKPEMKGDAACAQKCIKGGSPAVLVTEDGKIYKVANQDVRYGCGWHDSCDSGDCLVCTQGLTRRVMHPFGIG